MSGADMMDKLSDMVASHYTGAELLDRVRAELPIWESIDFSGGAFTDLDKLTITTSVVLGREVLRLTTERDQAVAASQALVEATQALGAMPDGYCFCGAARIGDNRKTHEPECRDLRAALDEVAK